MTKTLLLVAGLATTLAACSQPPASPAAAADDGAAARAKTAEAIRNSKYADLKPVGSAPEKKADDKAEGPEK